MKPITVREFHGIDLRHSATKTDPKALRVGKNVSVTGGKSIRTRPGFVLAGAFHPNSKGMYSTGDRLRAVAPSGYAEIFSQRSVLLDYVFINNENGTMPIDYVNGAVELETYGSTSAGEPRPFVTILNPGNAIEAHYVETPPAVFTDTPNTFVELPFTPSAGLLKLRSRLWLPSNEDGAVYFNAITGGAKDWTTPEDSGFIPVGLNAPQSQIIEGLALYRGYMAVVFEDSIQYWAVDENPDNITLVEAQEGPGSQHRRALTNVLGDLFYLSRGGTKRASTTTVTGEREESDIGNRLDGLDAELAKATNPIGYWSQTRAEFYLVYGSRALVLKYIPSEDIMYWSDWDLPVEITDVAELGGRLYMRGIDNMVYRLDADQETDLGEPIPFEATTAFIGKTESSLLWEFGDFTVAMTGTAKIEGASDHRDPDTYADYGEWTDSTDPYDRLYLDQVGPSIAFRFTGTGSWQLDGFAVSLQPLDL